MSERLLRRMWLVVVLGLAVPAGAEMNPHFAGLQPLLGKTWRGEFPVAKDGKPVVDVSRFELALSDTTAALKA